VLIWSPNLDKGPHLRGDARRGGAADAALPPFVKCDRALWGSAARRYGCAFLVARERREKGRERRGEKMRENGEGENNLMVTIFSHPPNRWLTRSF
jgi:hypothetical protein